MTTNPMDFFSRLALVFALTGFAVCARAADPATAADIAAKLSAQRNSGSSDVRLRMEIQQPAGTKTAAFQIQIKERRTPSQADVAYVILWPKERKGEALLVQQKTGSAPAARHISPDGKPAAEASISDPVFGSDLAIADTIDDFFSWKNQSIVGTEAVDRVDCQILESKPGPGDSSIYGRVKTWVDTRRMVPLRVEKYLPSGKLARRIETERVVPQGSHGNLPGNLKITTSGRDSVTDLDGSRINRDVVYSDHDFTPEGLQK
jgi:outer membrane lipoprotein-sorting protein